MKSIPTFTEFANKSNKLEEGRENNVSAATATEFVTSVLKLGSKDNLFDAFIKRKGLNSNDVSELVKLVATEIQTKWL